VQRNTEPSNSKAITKVLLAAIVTGFAPKPVPKVSARPVASADTFTSTVSPGACSGCTVALIVAALESCEMFTCVLLFFVSIAMTAAATTAKIVAGPKGCFTREFAAELVSIDDIIAFFLVG